MLRPRSRQEDARRPAAGTESEAPDPCVRHASVSLSRTEPVVEHLLLFVFHTSADIPLTAFCTRLALLVSLPVTWK